MLLSTWQLMIVLHFYVTRSFHSAIGEWGGNPALSDHLFYKFVSLTYSVKKRSSGWLCLSSYYNSVSCPSSFLTTAGIRAPAGFVLLMCKKDTFANTSKLGGKMSFQMNKWKNKKKRLWRRRDPRQRDGRKWVRGGKVNERANKNIRLVFTIGESSEKKNGTNR